jgi:hypothetical protein
MATPSSLLRMPATSRVTLAESRSELSAKPTPEPGLDELLYATAHDGIGCKALASALGVRLHRLYDAVNPHEGKPFDVRWLVPFMKAAGDFAVLRWMARACGFVIHEQPKSSASPAELIALTGECTREMGDVLAVLGVVLADGAVSAQDARLARAEVAQLLERAHLIDQTLARIEAGR